MVDGKSQAGTKENRVQLWLGGDDLEAAESETVEAYPGVTHTRKIVRVGDCFVVVDWLKSEVAHTYDFYLHSEGRLSLDGGTANSRPVDSPVRWIESPSALAPQAAVSGRWSEGDRDVAFWLAAGSGPVTPIIAQCPAETGSRKVPLLIGRQRGKAAEFVAVLFPYRDQGTLSVERRANELTIHHVGLCDRLTISATSRPSVVRE